jgi:hypothetical protein
MEKPSDQQRVFLVGRAPGVITIMGQGALHAPTLAGYVRQTCEQVLAVIEADGRLPEGVIGLIRDLRVEYLRATWIEADPALIARFQRLLGEVPEGGGALGVENAAALFAESVLETLSSDELASLSHSFLMEAEALLRHSQLSEYERARLYTLRDAYNEALGREAEGRGEEDEDGGDPQLYKRFMAVLGEQPKSEQRGRRFPKGSERVKPGETCRGGSTYFARKR